MVRLLKFQASLLHDLNIGVTSRLISCSSLGFLLLCVSPYPSVFCHCRVRLFSCTLSGQNVQIGFAWWGSILISSQEIRRIVWKRNLRSHVLHFSRELCFLNVHLFNHKQAGPLGFHHRGVCSQDYCPGIPSDEKSLLLDWTCLVSANHKSGVISYSESSEGSLLCICKTCCVLKSRISLNSSFKTVRREKRLGGEGWKRGTVLWYIARWGITEAVRYQCRPAARKPVLWSWLELVHQMLWKWAGKLGWWLCRRKLLMCWDELTFLSSEGGRRALHRVGWKNWVW